MHVQSCKLCQIFRGLIFETRIKTHGSDSLADVTSYVMKITQPSQEDVEDIALTYGCLMDNCNVYTTTNFSLCVHAQTSVKPFGHRLGSKFQQKHFLWDESMFVQSGLYGRVFVDVANQLPWFNVTHN